MKQLPLATLLHQLAILLLLTASALYHVHLALTHKRPARPAPALVHRGPAAPTAALLPFVLVAKQPCSPKPL